MSLHDAFTSFLENSFAYSTAPDAFIIPMASAGGFSNYVKFANRESIDFPIVGLAFQASPEKNEYRLAFTAVDRRPVRGQKVESFLKGKSLTPEVVEEAAQLATKEASPVKNSLYAPSYKRTLMGSLLRSVLKDRALS